MKKKDAMNIATDENSSSDMLDLALGIHKEVDRNLAQHPKASTNLLGKLSRRKDKATRVLAIIHPNFPPDQLIQVPSLQVMDMICSVAFSKLSLQQLSEIFRLLDRVKMDQLLALHDCPLNALEWAVDAGSDHDRSLVAQREYLPAVVREKLIAMGGEIAAAASKPRELVLNRMYKIIGDYRKNMEIGCLERSYGLFAVEDDWCDIYFERYAEILRKNGNGNPIIFSNNDAVESIRLNICQMMHDYIIFEDLRNLKVLEIQGDEERFSTLTWLTCRNLPSLEKVVIKGRVRWLEIDGVPRLQSLKLDGCQLLAHLEIRNAKNLERLTIARCRLLRYIIFKDAGKYEKLEIRRQIESNQKKSRKRIKLRSSMTFTEIDATLDVINEGYKLAIRKNLLVSRDGSDIMCGGENDEDFHPFGLEIARPLEHVYSGGTGETYFYQSRNNYYGDGMRGVWDGQGCEDEEDCLVESLRAVMGLTTWDSSPADLLKFFVDLLAQREAEARKSQQRA